MKSKLGSQQAFPNPIMVADENGRPVIHGGMDIRNLAAVVALHGLLTSPRKVSDIEGQSVRIADRLLAELEKEQ